MLCRFLSSFLFSFFFCSAAGSTAPLIFYELEFSTGSRRRVNTAFTTEIVRPTVLQRNSLGAWCYHVISFFSAYNAAFVLSIAFVMAGSLDKTVCVQTRGRCYICNSVKFRRVPNMHCLTPASSVTVPDGAVTFKCGCRTVRGFLKAYFAHFWNLKACLFLDLQDPKVFSPNNSIIPPNWLPACYTFSSSFLYSSNKSFAFYSTVYDSNLIRTELSLFTLP